MAIREPELAGKFYPESVLELKKLIHAVKFEHKLGPQKRKVRVEVLDDMIGAVVPHASIPYSGPAAAHVYARIPKDVTTVILVGPNHRSFSEYKAALSSFDGWKTPLGVVECDLDVARFIADACSEFGNKSVCGFDDRAHEDENSLEVQLPFLQEVLDPSAFKIVPIVLSTIDSEPCDVLGKAIAKTVQEYRGGRRFLILASSDFSHYVPAVDARRLDHMAIDQILRLDAPGLLRTVVGNHITMCGVAAVASMLFALKALGVIPTASAKQHSYYTSGDIAGDRGSVVGYAGITITARMDR